MIHRKPRNTHSYKSSNHAKSGGRAGSSSLKVSRPGPSPEIYTIQPLSEDIPVYSNNQGKTDVTYLCDYELKRESSSSYYLSLTLIVLISAEVDTQLSTAVWRHIKWTFPVFDIHIYLVNNTGAHYQTNLYAVCSRFLNRLKPHTLTKCER